MGVYLISSLKHSARHSLQLFFHCYIACLGCGNKGVLQCATATAFARLGIRPNTWHDMFYQCLRFVGIG